MMMMMINSKKIKELERRIKELEDEIERLKFEKNLPKSNPIPLPMPTYPMIPETHCSVCGMKFDGPMGYVCYHPRCPTGIAYC